MLRALLLSAALLLLASSSPDEHIICVSSSPSPEFHANPFNYAHFLLAHVYPLSVQLAAKDGAGLRATRVRFYVVEGKHGNGGLVAWQRRYEELFTGAVVEMKPVGVWPVWTGCHVRATISVPKFSFCRPEYWEDATALSKFAKRHLGVPLTNADSPDNAHPRIVVILRRPENKGHRTAGGLNHLCAGSALARKYQRRYGAVTDCLSLNATVPLRETAAIIGGAVALIGMHGAGLANAVLLPTGAHLVEIDAVENAATDRSMYQDLANHLGLNARKVWISAGGDIAAEPEGHAVAGKGHIGTYAKSVTVSEPAAEAILDEVLRSRLKGWRSVGQ